MQSPKTNWSRGEEKEEKEEEVAAEIGGLLEEDDSNDEEEIGNQIVSAGKQDCTSSVTAAYEIEVANQDDLPKEELQLRLKKLLIKEQSEKVRAKEKLSAEMELRLKVEAELKAVKKENDALKKENSNLKASRLIESGIQDIG